jgi:hypothetical protein
MRRDAHPSERGGDAPRCADANAGVGEAIEIRSYRRVFALERRLYRLDGLRLNPAGIPLRGIAYFAVLLLGSLALSAAPLLGELIAIVPWYVRAGLAPALAAFALTAVNVDGRPFHLAAPVLLRYGLSRRHGAGGRACPAPGSRWYPPDLLVLSSSRRREERAP